VTALARVFDAVVSVDEVSVSVDAAFVTVAVANLLTLIG